MNTKSTNQKDTAIEQTFADVCLASCQKLVAQIERVKDSIVTEFREKFAAHEQLLNQAIGEAEALAWQTAYPQLVFATLATEKVQAAAQWSVGQQFRRQGQPVLALAA
jgi:hypothetical protein